MIRSFAIFQFYGFRYGTNYRYLKIVKSFQFLFWVKVNGNKMNIFKNIVGCTGTGIVIMEKD
jgi:hypothetical protein